MTRTDILEVLICTNSGNYRTKLESDLRPLPTLGSILRSFQHYITSTLCLCIFDLRNLKITYPQFKWKWEQANNWEELVEFVRSSDYTFCANNIEGEGWVDGGYIITASQKEDVFITIAKPEKPRAIFYNGTDLFPQELESEPGLTCIGH